MNSNLISNPKLYNRALIQTVYPRRKPLIIAVNYHKGKPHLKLYIDPTNKLIQNNEIQVSMFRNLDHSWFANTFLNLKDRDDMKVDARNQFFGIKESSHKKIFKIIDEHMDLENNKKNNVNNINIFGWKVYGTDQDFLYYLIQRSIFNRDLHKILVRTCALQLYTESAFKKLSSIYRLDNDSTEKENSNNTVDISDMNITSDEMAS